MGLITIVRHGQARIDGENYDQLSDRGVEQSRLLGEWLARKGRRFDRVLTGPLQRHRETCEAASEAARSGGAELPEAQLDETLTEHQAIAVMDHVLGPDGRKGGLDSDGTKGEEREKRQSWFADFDRVMRQWIRQEIDVPHLENWQQARARVAGALDRITVDQIGEDVLIFSSGGFLSMALGQVWGLPDEAVYELMLEVNNSAWSEIRLLPDSRRVRCFNWHPHLEDPELLTLV